MRVGHRDTYLKFQLHRRLRQEDHKLETSLGNLTRLFQIKRAEDIV